MIIVRKIEEKDLEQLGDLYKELSDKPTNMENLRKTFQILEKDKNYILLGAEINGRLAGTLMGIFCYDLSIDCRPFLVIENVVVAKQYRERGIGKKMMEYIEKEAENRDCYYSMLLSSALRKEAHIFYEKIGYSRELALGYKKFL